MRIRIVQWAVALLVAALVFGTLVASAAAVEDRAKVIVGYRGSLGEATQLVEAFGGRVTIAYGNIPALAASVPARAVGSIASSAKIEYVEPVQARYLSGHIVPGEVWDGTPEILPWGTERVGAVTAWETTKGAGARVAVLDTGIDTTHADLADNLDLASSWDFLEGDADPSDVPGPYQGHGTLASGNIAAIDNEIGTVGVAPEAEIVFFRVCHASAGICYTDAIVAGVDAAIEAGVDVVSMSFGGNAISRAERVIMRAAWNAGIVLVASSGNGGRPPVNFPAALPEVIAVGATDRADRLAGFSSYGHDQELVAPGVDVPSTFISGLGRDALLSVTSPMSHELSPNPMSFSAAGHESGDLVFVGLGMAAEIAGKDLSGKIALIARGTISFKEKVANVAGAGATAAVIHNNAAGNFFGTLQELSAIPAVSISLEEGMMLRAALAEGTTVVVDLEVSILDYDVASGTSFSAPHVSGVAALVASANSELSNWEIRVILAMTASDLGPAGYDRFFGFGLVNAADAVAAATAP